MSTEGMSARERRRLEREQAAEPVEEAPAAAEGGRGEARSRRRGRSIDGGIRGCIGRRAAVFARGTASGCCSSLRRVIRSREHDGRLRSRKEQRA